MLESPLASAPQLEHLQVPDTAFRLAANAMYVPNFENIPSELKSLRQWVVWRFEKRNGPKLTKVPYEALTGTYARADDAITWCDFEDALSAYQSGQYDGVGFVFSLSDPYAGMDLDGCRNPESGEIEPWATALIEILNSYTEISPSGTGCKIWVKANHPGYGFRKAPHYEMYDSERYFTVTGNRVANTPAEITEKHKTYNGIHRQIFGEKPTKAKRSVGRPAKVIAINDADLLEMARSSKNGNRFSSLYAGDISGYGSQNEADLALCSMLIWWAGGDLIRADALFRDSGLMRDKWDERRGQLTYGQKTLNMAIEGKTKFYSVRGPSAASIASGISKVASRLLSTVSIEDNSEEVGETGEIESKSTDPAFLIAEIRIAQDTPMAKKKAMTAVVLATLEREGVYHKDEEGGLWYFDNARHELLWVVSKKDAGGEEFQSQIAIRFGLNRTEGAFAHVMADIEDTIRKVTRRTVLRKWSHYDDKSQRLYISDGNGYMFRLDGTKIDRVFNGDDGVLFSSMSQMQPLGNLDFQTAKPNPNGGLKKQILELRFEETTDITAENQALLWLGYVYALPFESILPTKPIATFVGEKGSGKSLAFKKLSHFLLGRRGNVIQLPNKQEDFEAVFCNSRFLWLDNVDSYRDWLMDALACAATGGEIVKRKLYVTNEVANFTPHCWIGITTREPKFRRDDVADRALLFRMSRIPDAERRAENEILSEIDDNRESLFIEYILDLNQIVAYLQKDREPLKVESRMADWGTFFMRIMRMLNQEEAGHAALKSLVQEQITFTVEGDAFYDLLNTYIPELHDKSYTGGWRGPVDAASLCRDLIMIAENEKRDVHFKPHTIGARLKNSVDAIHRSFIVITDDVGGRKRNYYFRRRTPETEMKHMEKDAHIIDEKRREIRILKMGMSVDTMGLDLEINRV